MHDNDFTGFKFNGIHFTIFPYPGETNVIKLARVSDGDRYNMELLPQSQDATVNVPGGDGTYYFGTNFTGKTFVINFAFDSLSETDLRTLRQTFAKRNELAPLIFDEEPYKYWMVKCVGMPSIKTICFNGDEKLQPPVFARAPEYDDSNPPQQTFAGDTFYSPFEYSQFGDRIYKGEGTVEFVAYYPFARCGSNGTSKWVSGYSTTPSSGIIYAPTMSQWIGAAGLSSSQGTLDAVGSTTCTVYNPGDMEAEFSVIIAAPTTSNYSGDLLWVTQNSSDHIIKVSNFTKNSGDIYLRYNSRTQLLEGCDSSKNPTGRLYNRNVLASSTMFKIPRSSNPSDTHILAAPTNIAQIDYDYLYY